MLQACNSDNIFGFFLPPLSQLQVNYLAASSSERMFFFNCISIKGISSNIILYNATDSVY